MELSDIIKKRHSIRKYADKPVLLRQTRAEVSAICFVILGYIYGDEPQTKQRKANRIKIIE